MYSSRAKVDNIRVLKTLGASISVTGRELTCDLPRSPCNTPLSHRTYRAGTGSLSPILSRRLAKLSSVASRPKTRLATSPGKTSTKAKIRTDTTIRVKKDNNTRLITTRTNFIGFNYSFSVPGNFRCILFYKSV